MLGPTHLRVWRRPLAISAFVAGLLGIFGVVQAGSEQFLQATAGAIVLAFVLVVVVAQIARFTIPAVRTLETQTIGFEQPFGPSRMIWLLILGTSIALSIAIWSLSLDLTGPLANFILLLLAGRYVVWPFSVWYATKHRTDARPDPGCLLERGSDTTLTR